jgi:hypothetical protein
LPRLPEFPTACGSIHWSIRMRRNRSFPPA